MASSKLTSHNCSVSQVTRDSKIGGSLVREKPTKPDADEAHGEPQM